MLCDKSRETSARRLRRFSTKLRENRAGFTFEGRSGYANTLNRQWARILSRAADRLEDGAGEKGNARSAKRVLKLARRLNNGSCWVEAGRSGKPRKTARQWARILSVAAQRLLLNG